MQCKDVELVLEQEGIEPLPEETRAHLAECRDCRNYIADLTSLGYATVLEIIEAGLIGLRATSAVLPMAPRVPLDGTTLLAPIPRPPRIFCIGLNYQKHADESNMPVQKVPTVFMKLSSSVVGPDHPIILPAISAQPM